MREGPYRDGELHAPRVYRASYLGTLRYAGAALFLAAVSAAIAYRVFDGNAGWVGLTVLGLFGVGSLGMAAGAAESWYTRLVICREYIASVTPTKTVTLPWEQIGRVGRLVIDGQQTYILHGLEGGQINVSGGLRDFAGATAELRERLGPLPGD